MQESSKKAYSHKKSPSGFFLSGAVFGSIAAVILFGFVAVGFVGTKYLLSEGAHVYSVRIAEVPEFGENSVGMDALDALLQEHNSEVSDLFPHHNDASILGRWVLVSDSDEDLLDELRAIEGVEVAEEQVLVSLPPYEIFEEGDKTWNLEKVQAAEAHKMLGASPRVIKMCVVDTGVDRNHIALKEGLLPGRDIINSTDDPSNKTPSELHATHVTSTFIMDPRYSNGSYGIAYPYTKVMNARVLNERGTGTFTNVAKGIVWCADNGADIINMSLGSIWPQTAVHDAIKYAGRKGLDVFAAKGNSNTDSPHYPADYPEVISAAATTKDDQRAYFSNFGTNTGCAGPGHVIFGALPNNKFGFLSGTSMASPECASGGATIRSKKYDITREKMHAVVREAGDEIKTDKPIGRRMNLVNYLKAVS